MTIKLLAYTPDERWAFILENEQHIFLKTKNEIIISDLEMIERAVAIGGYIASNMEFNTRTDLFEFLNSESVRVWREKNPPIDISELRKRIITGLKS